MARRNEAREPYSYLHEGTTVEGKVRAGRLRVDGTLRGRVEVEGVLEIAPGGRIEGGPVQAHDVRIAGEVVADVWADGTVEIWKGGRLEGDVRAGALDVDEGGRFLGRSLAPDEPVPEGLAASSEADVAPSKSDASAVATDDATA